MERLTKTYSDGTHGASDSLPCGENSYNYKNLLIEKLGKYEDLEEQGRLVKLPCKVGARLYWIDDEDDYGHKEMCIKQYSESEKVTGFSLGEDGEVFVFIGYDGSEPSMVGERYALLTRELAEAKLKELRGGENE